MFASSLNALVLLDRTGSMSNRWEEALGAINTYVNDLKKNRIYAEITVACFDCFKGFQFDLIRNSQKIRKWKPIATLEASPRGFTPLFDAIVRIVSMAEAEGRDNTLLIVVTDGAENASKEATKRDAYEAIERCKARGWQTVFLGADFDAFEEAKNVGVSRNQVLRMSSGNYDSAMHNLAEHTVRYVYLGKDFSFTDNDRRTASKQTS